MHHVLRIVGVTQGEEVRIPSDDFAGMLSSVFFWVDIGNLYYVGILYGFG